MPQNGKDPEAGIVTQEVVTPRTIQPPNISLERESQGCASILFYIFIFLLLDVWKQVTSYGMKYYNGNRYPIPQTQVVALTECFKFSIFIFVLVYTKKLREVKISFWYALPSIFYAINNNVYYFALNFVTPPVWNIISQLRVLFTALTYRLFFKRKVTYLQWVALTILIIAIVMTNMAGGGKLEGANNFTTAVILAVVGSVMSVFGTIVMEYLFKNDERPFAEMQMQLYLFSGIVAWIFYALEIYNTKQHSVSDSANWNLVMIMVAGCIALSCTSGISVAFIVKKLDNIVKLYSQALSNMLTSIACSVLFPDHFHLNFMFLMCLLVMFGAICLYENNNWSMEDIKYFLTHHRSKIPGMVIVIIFGAVAWLIIAR